MKARNWKNQEKGFATILAVVVTSLVLVTSLTSVYVYYVNNLRYQARIKEAYRMMSVMEQAAKIVRSAWDKAAATTMQGYGGDISGLDGVAGLTVLDITAYNAQVATEAQNAINTLKADPVTCDMTPANPANPICVDVDNSDEMMIPDPSCYCFADNDESYQAFNWNLQMKNPEIPFDDTRAGRFIAKLNKFFDETPDVVERMKLNPSRDTSNMIAFVPKPVFLGWALVEGQALAGGSEPRRSETEGQYKGYGGQGGEYPEAPGNLEDPNAGQGQGQYVQIETPNVNCSRVDAGDGDIPNQCMKCGGGTGVACVNLYGCPGTFGSMCEGVTPGNINEKTAMFRQPLMVVPMGHGTRYK